MSSPDYLLPFYLTATVRDKRKEMSGARDRDYHDAITGAPQIAHSAVTHRY